MNTETNTEITNKEKKFTIKLDESYQLELEAELFIKICKEMPVLKQIWFNFNVKYDDILNLENRVVEIPKHYNVYQTKFLLIIRMIKDINNMFIPEKHEIDDIFYVLNTLGGCKLIENRLDEITEQNSMKEKETEEESGLCVREPVLDKFELFEWRTLIMNIGFNAEKEVLDKQNKDILKIQTEGYTYASCNGYMYHFRKKI